MVPMIKRRFTQEDLALNNDSIQIEVSQMEGQNILVVDDEKAVRTLLNEILKKEGYSVFQAANGIEALQIVQGRDIDVAILDVHMPGMDGIEVLRELKALRPETEVLMMTGWADLQILKKSVDGYGAFDYLLKPCQIRELLTSVQNAVFNRKNKRQHREKDLVQIIHQLEDKLKRTTRGLRSAQVNYRNIIEKYTDGIVILDKNAKVRFCNHAAEVFLDRSSKELEGKPISLPVDLDNPKEVQLTMSNGELRIGETQIQDTEWAGEKAFMISLHDITEQRRYQNELKQTLRNLRTSLEGMIHAIALTVETRDPYTAGHQRRVSRLARLIANELKLDKNVIEGVRFAAIIHDLGKIAVPSEILSKPGKISEIEFALIKNHSQVGYDILNNIEFPWPIARAVLQHHEKLNGKGYPNGLKGDEICIEARILSVADVVEAMASHRPYRPALGIEAALAEILKNRGTVFDPRVVDACVNAFSSGKIDETFEFSTFPEV